MAILHQNGLVVQLVVPWVVYNKLVSPTSCATNSYVVQQVRMLYNKFAGCATSSHVAQLVAQQVAQHTNKSVRSLEGWEGGGRACRRATQTAQRGTILRTCCATSLHVEMLHNKLVAPNLLYNKLELTTSCTTSSHVVQQVRMLHNKFMCCATSCTTSSF